MTNEETDELGTTGKLILISLVVGGLLIIAAMILEGAVYRPLAAEDARQQCLSAGFDNYDRFSKIPFTKEALGVKCVYESKYLLTENGKVLVDGR